MITKMQPSVREILGSGAELIDKALERLLPGPDQAPVSIHRAMRHSVFAGGKRLRPVLCMEAARMIACSGQLPQGVTHWPITSGTAEATATMRASPSATFSSCFIR